MEVTIPIEGIEAQVAVCLFIVVTAIFLMERRKNPSKLLEEASSMYLCGETERVVMHNKSYRVMITGKLNLLFNERINRMILYILLTSAILVMLVWISLPRLW